MLQLKKPQDFVIGTGKLHSVKDFLNIAFNYVNLDYKKYIKINKKFYRPYDKFYLLADTKKAKKTLKWRPEYTFEEMLDEMVTFWLNHFEKNSS